jgi:hypothetical protein
MLVTSVDELCTFEVIEPGGESVLVVMADGAEEDAAELELVVSEPVVAEVAVVVSLATEVGVDEPAAVVVISLLVVEEEEGEELVCKCVNVTVVLSITVTVWPTTDVNVEGGGVIVDETV